MFWAFECVFEFLTSSRVIVFVYYFTFLLVCFLVVAPSSLSVTESSDD